MSIATIKRCGLWLFCRQTKRSERKSSEPLPQKNPQITPKTVFFIHSEIILRDLRGVQFWKDRPGGRGCFVPLPVPEKYTNQTSRWLVTYRHFAASCSHTNLGRAQKQSSFDPITLPHLLSLTPRHDRRLDLG